MLVCNVPPKVALTDCDEFKVTAQLPVPLQAPPQPAKVKPLWGVAVNVICVPDEKSAVHAVGQLMPLGLLATEPFPTTETVNAGSCAKVAVTD